MNREAACLVGKRPEAYSLLTGIFPVTMPTILIVNLADRDAANAACEKAGLGPETFVAALSPTGEEPVTHFWCERDDVDRVRSTLDRAGIAYRTAQADDPQDAFTQMGLRIMPLGPGA